MNWKRLALCAMLGITVLGTTACGTKSGEQPQGNTVKAETVAMPNFTNAPIADEYAIFDTNYGQFKVRLYFSIKCAVSYCTIINTGNSSYILL